jgi:hypothetical protein
MQRLPDAQKLGIRAEVSVLRQESRTAYGVAIANDSTFTAPPREVMA